MANSASLFGRWWCGLFIAYLLLAGQLSAAELAAGAVVAMALVPR